MVVEFSTHPGIKSDEARPVALHILVPQGRCKTVAIWRNLNIHVLSYIKLRCNLLLDMYIQVTNAFFPVEALRCQNAFLESLLSPFSTLHKKAV